MVLPIILGAALAAQPAPAPYDLVLRGGTIIDGTGGPPFRGDVAIAGAHIARIGALDGTAAVREIDVAGLHVAPGFLNLHSHADPAALATAVNMLTQGVTFELLNADGGGRLDVASQTAEAAATGLALNVGAYIGFNAAWAEVVGNADRRPNAEEIARMGELLTANLAEGAWGVSAGLDYKPAYYASAEEVVAVLEAAAPWRTDFTNHDRLTPETRYSSRAAVAETIGIGSRAGLVPVVTHMKVQGREQGSASSVLGLMREATSRGNYTAADAYPYLAGQTGLGSLLVPGWAQDGGRERMLLRLADPATRAKIVTEIEDAMMARFGGPDGVYLPASQRELTDAMRETGAGAGETVVRLLERENQGAILRFGSEADLVRILQHPTTSVACDCGASLPGRGSHPRNQGSYPRVLGRYVREQQVLSWEDAVRKMTLLPATTIGAIDRGALAAGMAADVTVFDPRTVIDRATYAEPLLPSEGIRYVIVNGQLALDAGTPTGVRAGRRLLRTRDMPSRPMTAASTRRKLDARAAIAVPGGQAPWQVRVALAQGAADRAATGAWTIVDGARAAVFEITDLGLLQVNEGWATVTASARRIVDGRRTALTLVVEQADPWHPDRAATAVVFVDGEVAGRGGATRVRIDSGDAPRR